MPYLLGFSFDWGALAGRVRISRLKSKSKMLQNGDQSLWEMHVKLARVLCCIHDVLSLPIHYAETVRICRQQ